MQIASLLPEIYRPL